jgi:hypothetical protein
MWAGGGAARHFFAGIVGPGARTGSSGSESHSHVGASTGAVLIIISPLRAPETIKVVCATRRVGREHVWGAGARACCKGARVGGRPCTGPPPWRRCRSRHSLFTIFIFNFLFQRAW